MVQTVLNAILVALLVQEQLLINVWLALMLLSILKTDHAPNKESALKVYIKEVHPVHHAQPIVQIVDLKVPA